jgi:hypothetical protein
MTKLVMKISEDYDLDHEIEEESNLDNEIANDLLEVENLSADMKNLSAAYTAIESFGISTTSIEILRITGLLSSTALDKVALESNVPECGDSVNSKIALEALTDEIKEKVAKWSVKLLDMAKKAGEVLSKVVTPIWEKIKKFAELAKEKIGNNPAVQYVKTHPYETIFYSISAIVAIYATVNFAIQAYPALTAADSVLVTFNKNLVNKLRMIKLPWGKIYTKVVMDGKVVMCEIIPEATKAVKTAGSASKLGWTKGAVDTILNLSSKAFSGAASVIKDVNKYYMSGIFTAGNLVKFVTGSKVLGTATAGFLGYGYGKIVGALSLIAIGIVKKTFGMIRETFSNLKDAVTKTA